MKKTTDLFAFLALIFWFVLMGVMFSGCAATRRAQSHSAEAVAAAHESTIARSVTGPVTPNINVSGSSNVVTVTPAQSQITTEVTDQANTKGEASGSSRSTFRASISGWLALAVFAIALGILLLSWVVFSRGSATGRAADAAMGNLASMIRSQCMGSTDPEVIAMLSPLETAIADARGKLKR